MNGNRKFGVEIEFLGNKTDALEALHNAGIEVEFRGYTHETCSCWKIVTDGSVSGPAGEGLELVSPPMTGREGMRQIELACEALRASGARINRTCGMHVHHDASDFDGKKLRGLLRLYQRAEDVLDTLHPESRRGNACEHSKSMAYVDVRMACHTASDSSAQALACEFDTKYGRYRKVNIAAYRRHGTVEFRQHAGTLDAAKICSWVVLTQAMMEKAAGGRLSLDAGALPNWERVKQAIGLTTYWGGSETEQAAAEYYGGRRKALQAASV